MLEFIIPSIMMFPLHDYPTKKSFELTLLFTVY